MAEDPDRLHPIGPLICMEEGRGLGPESLSTGPEGQEFIPVPEAFSSNNNNPFNPVKLFKDLILSKAGRFYLPEEAPTC